MLCSKCGKELPEESEFCSYCGINLKEITNYSNVKVNKEDDTKEQEKIIEQDNSEIIIFTVIGIIMLLIAIFTFIKYGSFILDAIKIFFSMICSIIF